MYLLNSASHNNVIPIIKQQSKLSLNYCQIAQQQQQHLCQWNVICHIMNFIDGRLFCLHKLYVV